MQLSIGMNGEWRLCGIGAASGREEIPHVQGQEQRPWRDTPRPRSGVAAALRWTSCVEIPHVQGQRNPSKTGRHWSSYEEITHVQGQRRSPSKMVGGANSCSESNPICTRDAQRAQTDLACTRTQGPHRDWDRTVSVSCGGAGRQWSAAGTGALGVGMA